MVSFKYCLQEVEAFSFVSANAASILDVNRIVVGYHGTSTTLAQAILRSGRFILSTNDYDWLGHGIYFWEYAPMRAWQWARNVHQDQAAVLEATIELGACLDLADIRYTSALKLAYDNLREAYIKAGHTLPVNRNKARRLDCLVINYVTNYVFPECDTVRAPFLEGDPIYDGSMLLTQSHIQVVVRNPARIQSGFRLVGPEVINGI